MSQEVRRFLHRYVFIARQEPVRRRHPQVLECAARRDRAFGNAPERTVQGFRRHSYGRCHGSDARYFLEDQRMFTVAKKSVDDFFVIAAGSVRFAGLGQKVVVMCHHAVELVEVRLIPC